MKILKYVLLLLALIIVGALIFGAMQPDSYDVKRSKVINAPASMVFNNLNDFKNWEAWGPWMEEDPSIVATYAEQTSGAGASYSWTSKDGPGSMETLAVEENKSLTQNITFGDYDPSSVYWTLEEVEGGTNVTWGMKNDNNPFMFKFFGAFAGGMDKMLGEMEEKGLDNMAKIIEEEFKNNPPMPPFKLGEITQLESESQNFIGYPQKAKTGDHEGMTALFMEFMPKAGVHAAVNKLEEGDYVPGALFTKYDEESGEAEFSIGLLLKAKLALAEGMESTTLPAGKTIKLSKYGNYGNGDAEAHMAIDAYMKTNGLEQNGPVWELYVNDPTKVKPEEIQTDIYYPVK